MPKGLSEFGGNGWDSTNETYVRVKVSSTGVLQTN
jgi:hypothetical protein